MKDLIDERNQKAKLKRSVVKAWNVNYIDAETMKQQEEEARRREAEQIIKRLEKEQAQDDALKQAEIEEAYAEAVRRQQEAFNKQETYNKTTGSYSGTYGAGGVDDVTRGQIDMILHEKDAMIQKLVQGGQ